MQMTPLTLPLPQAFARDCEGGILIIQKKTFVGTSILTITLDIAKNMFRD
jgi:hypothetical protein